jgi:hypothetical protein
MKGVAVRPYRPSDADGVSRLRVRAYPDLPEAHEDDWHRRLYDWLARGPLGGEMRRWVVDDDGEVVGHLASVAQSYRIDGRRVVAHTPADYMVMPAYGFHAVLLMRTFFQTDGDYVACNWESKATAIESTFGAVEAGELAYWIKPLDLSKRASGGRTKGVPVAMASRGLRVLDGALARTFGGRLSVQAVAEPDASFDALCEAVAAAVPCIAEKDAAFLRWRYGAGSPQWPVTILAVKDGEALLGYAVLHLSRHGHGSILDLTTRPGRRDVMWALVREVIAHSWRAGAYAIRYRFIPSSSAPSPGILTRLGFFSRSDGRLTVPGLSRTSRHRLFVKIQDPHAQAMARDVAHWAYSLGDGEAGFWVR